MGFCLGGGLVLLATARTNRFQAGVVYHQSLFPDARELESIDCRLQCHYGTNDHSTPREEVEAFTRAMEQYEKEYEIHWYQGMGHSFAQITPDANVSPAQRQAADLSQERSFEFLWRELGEDAEAGRPATDLADEGAQ
jgi:carboxymethylenebutenolidase